MDAITQAFIDEVARTRTICVDALSQRCAQLASMNAAQAQQLQEYAVKFEAVKKEVEALKAQAVEK